ncbi:MAG: ADP-ribosylglycohydrolase family protein [Akkermansia sp.]|nr:ADP-ribosylglycohydrolase family protein [Akkermansia sp.]
MNTPNHRFIDKAEGCLLGLMCGDALGAPVEFHYPEDLQRQFPDGITDMEDGWGATRFIRKGQITDDSEMAIALLSSLVAAKTFSADAARRQYEHWLHTGPADVGITIRWALRGQMNPDSQANGALMRIAPLGIYAALHPDFDWQTAAAEDCRITHIHPRCAAANIIYVESLILAIQGKCPQDIYAAACRRAEILGDADLIDRLRLAATEEPAYFPNVGWVEIAFHCAYYWLLHAENYRTAMCSIVNRIGDPDTNAAIAGALLGAVFGRDSIPAHWQKTVLEFPNLRMQEYHATTAIKLLDEMIEMAADR